MYDKGEKMKRLILDFPASADYSYYIKWMLDPAVTAEYVFAHSGDLPA